jgi:hypothetical protein
MSVSEAARQGKNLFIQLIEAQISSYLSVNEEAKTRQRIALNPGVYK